MSKTLILCADDFAQTEAVSDGIVTLLAAGRLSAVSCMTNSPRWHLDAQTLIPYVGRADIGLHFNLTHSFDQATQSLSTLIRSSLFRRLDIAPIRQALLQQIDQFESSMHRAPDFIDGHQHVHVFPQIRQVVCEVLAQRYPNKKPYLRRVTPSILHHDAFAKALILRLLAYRAGDEAALAGFRLPAAFAGLYSLSPTADFAGYMRRWLPSMPSGTLMMCHPGLAYQGEDDPIAAARAREMDYLLSDAFARDLQIADVRLSRFV